MTLLKTVEYPLAFWLSIQAQNLEKIEAYKKEGLRLLTPVNAILSTVPQARAEATRNLTRFNHIVQQAALHTTFAYSLDITLQNAAHDAKIFVLEHQLKNIYSRIDFLRTIPTSARSQEESGIQVKNLTEQYEALQRQGNTENGAEERKKITGLPILIPVYATEDMANVVSGIRALEVQASMLKLDLDGRKIEFKFSLELDDSLSPVLYELGIGIQPPMAAAEAPEPLLAEGGTGQEVLAAPTDASSESVGPETQK